jgi:hypothetical protein
LVLVFSVRLTLGGVVDVQNLAGMMSRPINTERIILVTVSKHLLVDDRKVISYSISSAEQLLLVALLDA